MKAFASSPLPPLLSALAALCISACAHAEPARVLGSTLLTKAENDVDVLRFERCRADVRQVQLRVKRSSAEIESIWVRFGNGERQTLAVRSRISKGNDTRWIDLNGGSRCIQSIGIIGDSEGSRRQARVVVYGR